MDPAKEAATRIGSVIDRKYVLERVIGYGGMGAVYEAAHKFTDRKVAVKLLHAKLAARTTIAERFRREMKAATHVDHPAIVEILDAGEDRGSLYLVFELLNGQDLGAMLEGGELTLRVLVEATTGVLSALEVAHKKNFVHRDIKPTNIFVHHAKDGKREIKLLDFGIARRIAPGGGKELTQAGAVIGTPYFMSPEQMCGEKVDERADLWAVGVVMFQALSGRLPFDAKNYVSLLSEMMQSGPIELTSIRDDIHPGLAAVVSRALLPNIGERFQTASEMLEALWSCGLTDRTLPDMESPARTIRDPTAPPTRPLPKAETVAKEERAAWEQALEAIERETDQKEQRRADPGDAQQEREGWLRRLLSKRRKSE